MYKETVRTTTGREDKANRDKGKDFFMKAMGVCRGGIMPSIRVRYCLDLAMDLRWRGRVMKE